MKYGSILLVYDTLYLSFLFEYFDEYNCSLHARDGIQYMKNLTTCGYFVGYRVKERAVGYRLPLSYVKCTIAMFASQTFKSPKIDCLFISLFKLNTKN